MSTVDEILEQALRLEADERTVLVDRLLDSLDTGESEPTDDEWGGAWAEEILRRIERIECGESQLIDWEDAKRRLRDSIARARTEAVKARP